MKTEELLALLEPSALADKAVDQLGALTSLAISAKRAADALDLIAQHLAPIITAREETPEERRRRLDPDDVQADAVRDGFTAWDAIAWSADDPDVKTPVEVQLRSGKRHKGRAGEFNWGRSDSDPSGDIVAYRVVT
jgi:hypothetical protein